MNGYFYHGIECYYGVIGYAAQLVVKILEEGILMRNQAHQLNDDKFNHICLYKKITSTIMMNLMWFFSLHAVVG